MAEETTTTTTPATTPAATSADNSLLKEFGPSIWTVDGPVVDFYGFPYPTRMVIIQLETSGETWIWSPIELTEKLQAEMTSRNLNFVKHVVTPNKIHHLYLKQWQDAFPDASFGAPPGLEGRKVVKDVKFDFQLDGEEQAPYHEEIDQVIFKGSFFMEEVVFFHRKSKTAIFGDLIQRFPEDKMTGFKGTVMKLDGLVGPNGSTPREWRFSFWFGGKGKARAARTTVVQEWKPENLVIAHGDCVTDGTATEVITNSLSWM